MVRFTSLTDFDLVKKTRAFGWMIALLCGLVLISGTNAAQAQSRPATIQTIEITGNQRIEPETIKSYMLVDLNDDYDDELIDRSLKALFATGLFADVIISPTASGITVQVVENPIINRIAFEGNAKLDQEELQAEVRLGPRVVYTRARVQADAQRIVELYRRSGRFAATVDPKIVELTQNRVDLIFEINEGPVTGVRRINFIGNRDFADEELRGLIVTEESRWWKVLASNDNYDPDRVAYDRELLRRFYLQNGYADFRVISAVAELTRDREDFYVTFTVDEGTTYRIGDVRVESEIGSLNPGTLRSLVKTVPGSLYNADEIDGTIEDMTKLAGTLGYAFVNIRPRVKRDRDTRTVSITYHVQESQRVYVERINIQGNSRTLDRVIRREFRLAEGDAFNAVLLDRSKTRIRALGFFGNVDVTTEDGSADDKTIINVEVEEQSTGELTLGAGFSSAQSFVAEFRISERNLLGRGQRLNLGALIGSRRSELDFSFTEPYFLGRNIAAGIDVFRVTNDFQDEASFDSESTGFGLRAGFPISEFMLLNTRLVFREDTIKDVGNNASIVVRQSEGSETTSSIGYTLTFDNRDDFKLPTRGYRVQFQQDFAGLGGTVSYLKTELKYAAYKEIFDGVIAIGKSEQGLILGFDDEVRIIDRFFLGPDEIRGFDRAGVGPRDLTTGDGLGGNLYYTLSGELNFPLGLPEEFGVRGSIFIDGGSLADIDDSGAGIVDIGSLRAATGFGISWDSPFGPIRIDFTETLLSESFDETETVNFRFGARL
ncbi:MAG: outer membrane protein assembly factor BamA [Alphaproteobacteria bacterium]